MKLAEQSDADLRSCPATFASRSSLNRAGHGEAGAIRECIVEFGPLVWSLCRRFCRSAAEAEDAAQDIFIEIWRCADRYDASRGSEVTFIATISRRRLIDRLRKHSVEPTMYAMTDDDKGGVCSEDHLYLDISLDARSAIRAMNQLPPKERRALELGYLCEMSQAEIAIFLAIPLGTVKSLMRRGLIRLRNLLEVIEGPRPNVRGRALAAHRPIIAARTVLLTVEASRPVALGLAI